MNQQPSVLRQIILGGLLLPFELYFQPLRFKARVRSLAPEFADRTGDLNLLRARHKLRSDREFRRAIVILAWQMLVAQLWVLIILLPAAAGGVEIHWLQVAVGVAVSVAGGVVVGVAFGVAVGVAVSVAVGVAFGVAGGVAVSVAYGVAYGVAGGVVVGVAFGVAFGVTLTHAWVYPVYLLWVPVQAWLLRRIPRLAAPLWHLSPPRNDEIILLPLPGLARLLVALVRASPGIGQQALTEVAAHRYQSWAARAARVLLAREDASRIASLPGLAAFHNDVTWLESDAAERDLLALRDISQEVASALASDSAVNRLRRLELAQKLLNDLQTTQSVPVPLNVWRSLVTDGVADARRQLEIHEPIPQVFNKDGRPIQPDSKQPFKGRSALFRKLEEALGGDNRTTLLLYGQRRTGKTSALYQLRNRLGSQIIPVFVDLQHGTVGGADDTGGFLYGLSSAITEDLRRNARFRVKLLPEDAYHRQPYMTFDKWLNNVENELNGRLLLLCLDEYTAIEEAIRAERLDTRILNTLRNIVQHRRYVQVLLSGSYQIDELPSHWVSALITTTPLSINFLDYADTVDLIRHPVSAFPDIFTPEAVDRIIHLTHCLPYFVQLTCALLVEMMNVSNRRPPQSQVTAADVDAIVPEVLSTGNNHFSDLWHNQTASETARVILEALAAVPGYTLPRDVVRGLPAKDASLRDALDTLLRRELIERVDESYRIVIPLVARYIQDRVNI